MKKFFNFEKKMKIFSIVKNYDLYERLTLSLKKNKFFLIKKKIN